MTQVHNGNVLSANRKTRRGWSRRRLIAIAVALVVLSLPWLLLVPAAIFHGLGVVERCDNKIHARYGEDTELVQGDEGVRWFPPSWECPATNGKTIYMWP